MKREYDTFVHSFSELSDGQEVKIRVRDLTPGQRKYEIHYVRGVVSSSPERIQDSALLWLRSASGVLHAQPWAIKVIEEYTSLEQMAEIDHLRKDD